jgi:hypothetical protein
VIGLSVLGALLIDDKKDHPVANPSCLGMFTVRAGEGIERRKKENERREGRLENMEYTTSDRPVPGSVFGSVLTLDAAIWNVTAFFGQRISPDMTDHLCRLGKSHTSLGTSPLG